MTLDTPKTENRGRKPGTKFTQRPRSDYERAKRVAVPPPPTIDRAKDKAASDAQQSARVEMLMLKGISSSRILGSLLDIEPEKEVNRLIGLVYARWTITGGGRDILRYRGEALARLDMLSSELWSRTASDNGEVTISERISAMKVLMDIEEQRNAILGLTPKVVERIALLPSDGGGLAARITEQDGLARIAERFMQLLLERRQAAGKPELPIVTVKDADFAEDAELYSDDAEITTAH